VRGSRSGRQLYVDTGAFIALVYSRDQAHPAMSTHFRQLRAQGARLITSDPVISETVTRLRYDAGLAVAQAFAALAGRAITQGTLVVRESDPGLREAAFGVLERFADLPLSYADAVGAAVAAERGGIAVFGLDNDFRVMGFVLEP
jgi:predicted nucleic acid-binding protein